MPQNLLNLFKTPNKFTALALVRVINIETLI